MEQLLYTFLEDAQSRVDGCDVLATMLALVSQI